MLYKLLLLTLFMAVLSSCGADVSRDEHETGVATEDASRFYLAVENVSRDLGLKTSDATSNTLTVKHPTIGSIQFTRAVGATANATSLNNIQALAVPMGDSTEQKAANRKKLADLYRALIDKSEREDLRRVHPYTR